MSRGFGRRERHVLAVCRAWAAAEPDPAWRWVPLDALVSGGGGASERNALRWAAYRLAEQGLVERGSTHGAAWLLRRHAGDASFSGEGVEAPHVQAFGGHRGRPPLVVRLPLSAEAQSGDAAERMQHDQRALAVLAVGGGL